jgi:4-hydroxy-tetrahydrodipicolinate reductase
VADHLDSIARARDVSILGSGINPGYLLDTLPLALSAACTSVTSVSVRRIVDTNRRRVPLQRKAGVGLDRLTFDAYVREGRIRHVGLEQSARLLAGGLGWATERWSEVIEPVIARQPVNTGVGNVSAGHALGLSQVGVATAYGRAIITYSLKMYAGAHEVDEIVIEGEPRVEAKLIGGVNGDKGTAAVIGNLVTLLPGARAGLLTMRDVMPLAGPGARAQNEVSTNAVQSGRSIAQPD